MCRYAERRAHGDSVVYWKLVFIRMTEETMRVPSLAFFLVVGSLVLSIDCDMSWIMSWRNIIVPGGDVVVRNSLIDACQGIILLQ